MARGDGGPAFPVTADGAYIPDCNDQDVPPSREFPGHPGMTLRDWFAGQAIAELIRISEAASGAQPHEVPPELLYEFVAIQAYAVADAMIAARSK